jgi:hypothetical protein
LPAGPSAVTPSVAAEALPAVTEPKPEPRPEVASPSGSMLPPPAPVLPANPPELPDPMPTGAASAEPVPANPAPANPVPVASAPASVGTVIVDGGEDVSPDDDTAPIPVITPDMPKPGPAAPAATAAVPAERIRAPFEPFERRPEPEPELEPEDPKLDQIKDLYLTAEAIGEDALNRHFQQVSDRQRQLIKEYFDQVATRDPLDEEQS